MFFETMFTALKLPFIGAVWRKAAFCGFMFFVAVVVVVAVVFLAVVVMVVSVAALWRARAVGAVWRLSCHLRRELFLCAKVPLASRVQHPLAKNALLTLLVFHLVPPLVVFRGVTFLPSACSVLFLLLWCFMVFLPTSIMASSSGFVFCLPLIKLLLNICCLLRRNCLLM